jgi:hypothetical protein
VIDGESEETEGSIKTYACIKGHINGKGATLSSWFNAYSKGVTFERIGVGGINASEQFDIVDVESM